MSGAIETLMSVSLPTWANIATIGGFLIALWQLRSIKTQLKNINQNINDIDIEVNPDISVKPGFKQGEDS